MRAACLDVTTRCWARLAAGRGRYATEGSCKMTVPRGDDVPTALAAMAAAVQAGDFAQAEALGAAASFPLALPKHTLRLGAALSEGAQATVYHAQYTHPSTISAAHTAAGSGWGEAMPVAVKRPRIRETADLERFRREVGLLAQLQHPGLVRLLGARMLPPDYCCVLGLEATNAAEELHSSGWRPGWAGVLSLGAQLAEVVAHMHAHGVVHRDIKPANLLLDATCTEAQLTDLGLAAGVEELAGGATLAAKPTGGFHKQHMVGTLEYMAPEVLLGGRHSCASDVYALGVTLAELASGIPPFSDCTRDNPLAHTVLEMGYGRQELAAAVAAEGLRPTLPADTPTPLCALLEACWQREPALRPAAAEVAARLEELAAELGCFSPAAPGTPPTPAHKHSVAAESPGSSGSRSGEGMLDSEPSSEGEEAAAAAAGSSSGGSSWAGLPPIAPSGRWGEAVPAWLEAAARAARAGPANWPSEGLPAAAVGAFASAGVRGADLMEDRHVVLRDLGGWRGVTCFGVFDGHRGAEAAVYLAEHLERHLAARWGSARSAGELLAGALADADAAFRAQQDAAWAQRVAAVGAEAAGRRPFPGSTAALVLVAGGLLAVANLGDSRAVLCHGGQALALTRDQTADREDERRRVEAAGGTVSHMLGGWRVGAVGMQVTRSVGDADLKPFVSADAEVAEVALGPGDAFLVLATDGVWDQLSSSDAVGLVLDTVKQPAMCAQRLVTEALTRGSTDNLSALVAVLPTSGRGAGGAATWERVYTGAPSRHSEGGRKGRGGAALAADEIADTY